jgi:hypothetical protein
MLYCTLFWSVSPQFVQKYKIYAIASIWMESVLLCSFSRLEECSG